MIIDAILDRRDAAKDGGFALWTANNVRYIYREAMLFGFSYLSAALDGGTEEQIKDALCRYIDENGYNPAIKDFVRSVRWLPADMD